MTNLEYIKSLSAEDLALLLLIEEETPVFEYGYDDEYEYSHTITFYITSDSVKFDDFDSALEHEIEWLNETIY